MRQKRRHLAAGLIQGLLSAEDQISPELLGGLGQEVRFYPWVGLIEGVCI